MIWLLKFDTPPNKTESVLFLTKNEMSDPKMGVYCTPKVGCFFLYSKIQLHCCFYFSARKKATAMVFIWGDRGYPDVRLNTKRSLSDIWLQWAKQFWVCLKKLKVWFFSKTPKTVLLISQQPNITQRSFCIQNERQDILYHLQ